MEKIDVFYNMELHEITSLNDNDGTLIRRVPGGWIYIHLTLNQTMMVDGKWSEEYLPTSVFVPFNKEFQKEK